MGLPVAFTYVSDTYVKDNKHFFRHCALCLTRVCAAYFATRFTRGLGRGPRGHAVFPNSSLFDSEAGHCVRSPVGAN